MPEPDETPNLSPEDVARRLNISAEAVRRAARNQRLHGTKLSERVWRFSERNVSDWLARGAQVTQA